MRLSTETRGKVKTGEAGAHFDKYGSYLGKNGSYLGKEVSLPSHILCQGPCLSQSLMGSASKVQWIQ